jgi:chemotaxis protein MotB
MNTTGSSSGSGSSQRARRRRTYGDRRHVEESNDRWLLTYADMITLLLVLFIVLFALSSIDQAKFHEFKQSVTRAVLTKIPHGTTKVTSKAKSSSQAAARLDKIKQELSAALSKRGLLRDVVFNVDASGLVEGLVADSTFFLSNSATLSSVGVAIVDTSAGVLKNYKNAIEVAGFTDNRPITSAGLYTNNWSLSAARATSVVVRMTEFDDVNPHQVVILGYGQYHPVVANTSPQQQAENRRVNIVISPSSTFVQ